MTVRIPEPALDNTEKLLEQILVPLIQHNERALFLCPAGDGVKILQRMRVMISRKRNKAIRNGKKPRRFLLRSTIHAETHDGKRYDACVCWQQVSESHELTEMLEDILTNV